jgi:hypothetical protein
VSRDCRQAVPLERHSIGVTTGFRYNGKLESPTLIPSLKHYHNFTSHKGRGALSYRRVWSYHRCSIASASLLLIKYTNSARSWTISRAWILYNQNIIMPNLFSDCCLTYFGCMRSIPLWSHTSVNQRSYRSHAIVITWKSTLSLKRCMHDHRVTLHDLCLTDLN